MSTEEPLRDALLEALGLKHTDRAGWLRVGVASPESVAAHSWGMALLVLLFLPDALNRERALTYAILHDLAETWTGDITPHDDVPDKHEREDAAMVAFTERIGRPDLLDTWRAYEAQADAEARFVKQLDRLDMGLTALLYARSGAATDEFLVSARSGLDEALRALIDST
jgi:putative hydrolase of HD superfamily